MTISRHEVDGCTLEEYQRSKHKAKSFEKQRSILMPQLSIENGEYSSSHFLKSHFLNFLSFNFVKKVNTILHEQFTQFSRTQLSPFKSDEF